MKTIALVAEKGAGKGLFVEIIKKLLPELRITSVRFSDVLCDILEILGKEKSRHNIDILVTALRQAFHDEGILNAAVEKWLKEIKTDIVILDGLRKEEEIPLVRERGGILVYIAVSEQLRYKRRMQAPEKTDEVMMTREQFIKQDNTPSNQKSCIIGETMADVTIENNAGVEEFESKIKEFIERYHLADK